MPRGRWKKARDFFCKKFSCEVSEKEFKRRAHTIKRDTLESDYSQTKKKIKLLNSLSPTSTIKAASVHQELKIIFYNQIKMNTSITGFQRTRKVPEAKVDKELFVSLNQIAGEYMVTNPPKPCAKLQGFSKQYSDATRKLHLSLSFHQIGSRALKIKSLLSITQLSY
ncbi:hypothetical protein TCON_2642 [Astathelohania contejeani]|uniref:Uncharacterized protein n=1 Tax=Astathelohania contejeani TaxID=164912 RepID=A0ABQ7HVF9_9MICR|nr:hypothetical protein TCON_2642 [Thelohania contejeani]